MDSSDSGARFFFLCSVTFRALSSSYIAAEDVIFKFVDGVQVKSQR
jgi:hypothetical protein